jgi:regulator of sigma E protease
MINLASSSLFTIAAFILALGLLVSFHEFGHYSVARLCGVKVLRFSIGFGPVLWLGKYGKDQTEWTLCAIPLGGYVKMVDEREGPVPPEDMHRAFNTQTVWRRAAIVAAGPIANFILAIALFGSVSMLGMPGLKPYVNAPKPESLAALAGIKEGQLVVAVDDITVTDWQDLRLKITANSLRGQASDLTVEQETGTRYQIHLPPLEPMPKDNADPVQAMGLSPWDPNIPARLGVLLPDGAAKKQGLKVGDEIIEVDNTPLGGWAEWVKIVRAHPNQPLAITVLREGHRISLSLTPDAELDHDVQVGRIGAGVSIDPELKNKLTVTIQRPVGQALIEGMQKTYHLSALTLEMMGRMLTGSVSSKGVGGPLQIAAAAGDSARLGFIPFLAFLGLMSVSLGVLNLLPVPVLDGGHLLYYSFELIAGRPIPIRWMELGTRVGLTLLVGLMALAFYNDINRFFSG